MEVKIRLFAMLRERAGTGELTVELPAGARVRDALEAVGSLANGLPLVMAVNREYAAEDQVLEAGDELALIPPVSGGERRAPPDGPAARGCACTPPRSYDNLFSAQSTFFPPSQLFCRIAERPGALLHGGPER